MIPSVSRFPRSLTLPLGFLTVLGCIQAILTIYANAQNTITYLDLVNPAVEEVTIGAGTFRAETLPGTAGTGNFDTFLKLNGTPLEEGYNTSASGVMDNVNGQWTHDLTVGDMSVVQDLTGRYLLNIGMDLNEPNSAGARYQSLDAFQVYVSPIGSQNTTDPTQLGTLIYNMDALANNALLLDVNRNSSGGSGRSDLNVYLDLTLFAGVKQSDFIYFYVKMGGVGQGEAPQYPNLSFANDGGFDELRRDYSLQSVSSIPEPSVAMLFALAATGLVFRRSRR
ncbi:MAG: PEP-CTERM sorting domain-containing protein [Verrucomicrobiota bacterium]